MHFWPRHDTPRWLKRMTARRRLARIAHRSARETSLNCPICANDAHRVLWTDAKDGRVRRSRECLKCAHRWRTVEITEARFDRTHDIEEAFRHMLGAIGE
jgi:Zn ribbon nucleic-acid-binding protein